jgi:hypothetical protein
MSTKITINPAAKPTMAQLRDLVKQALILENQNGTTGDSNLASVRAAYLRARELWPASVQVAASLVGNDNTFTAATLDALRDSSAP